MRTSHQLTRVLATLAMLLCVCFSARADTLRLKDGRVLEGTVAREQGGYVWFKYKIGSLEKTDMFSPADIVKLEKGTAATPPPAAPVKPATNTPPSTPASNPAAPPAPSAAEPANAAAPKNAGAPRAAILTLGESNNRHMVGLYVTADALERALPALEKDKVEVVVLRVNSQGGYLSEIQKISDVIEYKYKPKFRVVGWIESAISAAAMSSHCLEEIYFTPKGNYGACTGWSGNLIAVKGRDLEDVLYMMEKISARGKHDLAIMRSMQIMDPLSCNINENGDVQWFQNDAGSFIVNEKERVLTFNSETAAKYKFSRGTAENIEQLTKLMGYAELNWVGKQIPGVPYPVSEAEELQRSFRKKTADDLLLLQQYWTVYQTSVEVARQSQPADRGKFIARARTQLDNIKKMVKNNPNLGYFQLNLGPDEFEEWVEQREKELRDLSKK